MKRSTTTHRRPRRLAVGLIALVTLAGALTGCGDSDGGATGTSTKGSSSATELADVTINFGIQTADLSALFEASGLFEDTPYDLKFPLLSGAAAQLAALYSKRLDLAEVSDSSTAFESANAETAWTAETAPIQTIALWADPGGPLPFDVTAVRADAGIDTPADLKGHSWSYTVGGSVYAQYLLSLDKAGLTPEDIEPKKFADLPTAATAFNSGAVDVYSGPYAQIQQSLDSGAAKELLTSDDVDFTGGYGLATTKENLADPAKVAALGDLLKRLRTFLTDWLPTHEEEAVKIEQTVSKAKPAAAKLAWQHLQGHFLSLADPEFIARQQKLVDLTHESGVLKNNPDITAAYNIQFESITVG